MSIPVIDLFSGPGGLGEGFAGLDDGRYFHIVVSAEMDPAAHATLRLRSYFRRLKRTGLDLPFYYRYCNGVSDEPWAQVTEAAWREAGEEARQITLGTTEGNEELNAVLRRRIPRQSDCVVIGGPPCQAYSVVGRVRNRGNAKYRPEDDHRHFLYREYLRVLQRVRPAVFVMENVKGILSSQVGGRQIFQDILMDLTDPEAALFNRKGKREGCYRIHSLVHPDSYSRDEDVEDVDLRKFVIRAEEHGVPQARHRVILVGIREDVDVKFRPLRKSERRITVGEAIDDLPVIRSRRSRGEDSPLLWAEVVRDHFRSLSADAARKGKKDLADSLAGQAELVSGILEPGSLRCRQSDAMASDCWARRMTDRRLDVVLNHESRAHMDSDLRRYAYAATFCRLNEEGRSPKGEAEFDLAGLRPDHANWGSGHFVDRFRVQARDFPSTTITSHISKDGHYFIHWDPSQCRTLTVREAARLQTFPDNYFFQGNRTEQYRQVGNAVPPMLARKIAELVRNLIDA